MNKNTFVILTLGYWGKGRTITEAANNCRKEGGSKSDCVVIRMFPNTTDEQHKAITVNGYGEITYPNGIDCARVVSPSDGHKVKLSSVMGK